MSREAEVPAELTNPRWVSFARPDEKSESLVVAVPRTSDASSTKPDGDRIPYPEPAFAGHLGRTVPESTPAYPERVGAPDGAPNVVVIMLDDIGFGQAGVSGGPVPTPHMDALGASSAMLNRFHTTSLCSPTRAALLTGRNHHHVGFGTIVEASSGFPGYNCAIPNSAATVAETLKLNGYNTAWFGKNHNTPDWESSAAGPFDRWPTGLGFEYFYGFNGGETSQFEPQLYENITPVEAPHDPDYHLTEDLVSRATGWIATHESIAPGKPFLLYLAPGAVHAPHHVPESYRDRFAGQFDQGWDTVREEASLSAATSAPAPERISIARERIGARKMGELGGLRAIRAYAGREEALSLPIRGTAAARRRSERARSR